METIVELGIMAGLITGISEALKRAGVPKKALPFVAMLLGVGAMYLTKFSPSHAELILFGIMAGLMAVGLFESGKQIARAVKKS